MTYSRAPRKAGRTRKRYPQEIENVIRSEAEKAGVAIINIAPDRDAQLGLVARIRTDSGANLLQAALDQYAFNSEVREECLVKLS